MTDLNTAMSRGTATGILGVPIVARQDIDVLLQNEPDCFNLFILAIRELQKQNWQDKMSFYQLAGIHGLPNKPWDNVGGKARVSANNGSGYCNHGTPTFPTWHRPYLAIFEQSVYKKMQDIAASYTDPARKAVYQEAVKKFRLPYIDYHRPRNYNATFPGVVDPNKGSTSYPYDFSLPQILTLENITVKDFPADNIRTVPNPLAHFNFPQGSMSDGDWAVSGISPNQDMKNRTIRYPLNRFSRWDPLTAVNAAMNEVREESVRLSLLFIENGAYSGYETFATSGTSARDIDGQTASGSLESVHGNYHVFIGGSGHMSSVPTAAFDPIFWLHHCTIDRWFAIWQKSHPNSWFRNRALASQPLIPFRNAANQGNQPYWISDTANSTETFGYTYPELVNFTNPTDLQRKWEGQYGWARRLTATPQDAVKPPPTFEPLDLSHSQFFQGIGDFKPLNKSNVLMPPVRNLVAQPLRRAIAHTPQAPLAKPATEVSPQPTPPVTTSFVEMAAPVVVKAAEAVGVEPPKAAADAVKTEQVHSAPVVVKAANVAVNEPTKVVTDNVKTDHVHAAPPASSAPSKVIDESKMSREWYVDDIVERLAMNTSFTIMYFIGKFENTDSLVGLMMAPAFSGLNHVFAAPIEACDNCEQQEGVAHMVRSTSPITSMLLDYVTVGQLASMRPEHVKPFLIANLKWRVVTVDGRVVDPRDLSADHGFKNSVSCKVSPLPGQTAEVVYETYNDITEQIIRNAS